MTLPAVFTVRCPTCSASYPVDSGKVPAKGVRARCGGCSTVFPVGIARERARRAPESSQPEGARRDGQAAPASAEADESRTPAPFGALDPGDRAARLARVLVSDMIVYHPDRYERALERGTLREDFADEVRRSWAEYVRRVGWDLARGSRYFQEELNATLARGQKLY